MSISGARVTTASRLIAGAAIAPHEHSEHQMIYASDGSVAVVTEAGCWVAPRDRAIWIPAGVVHRARAFGRTSLRTVGMATDNPLGLSAPTVLEVGPLLRELILAYTGEPPAEAGRRRRQRAVILDELHPAEQLPPHVPMPRDPRLAAVCDILVTDPADRRTLHQLAMSTAVGARTLSRLFAHELGMTFPQWRTQLRLQHALRLLALGHTTTEVATRVGWSTPSGFADVFRRTMGVTPSDARR
ncbi:MAG: AraC family transcriptional regulator [Phycicoccus sp.]